MQDTPTYRAACDAHDTGASSLLDQLRDNVTGGLVAEQTFTQHTRALR